MLTDKIGCILYFIYVSERGNFIDGTYYKAYDGTLAVQPDAVKDGIYNKSQF